jgi:antitoxin component YwqK of YwqJK toxin-antitoxin module
MVGAINKRDEIHAKILHGPYRKLTDGKLEEEGIFYFGAKHGRWVYEKLVGDEMLLVEKEKYYKGHPKESNFSYFDVDKTKIKEVIPLVNGERHGDYVKYSEAGNLLSEGTYEYNVKVGKWTDYFDTNKRKIKRQLQYQKTWDQKDFLPFTLVEYDDKGKISYDKAAEDKKKPKDRKPDPTQEF